MSVKTFHKITNKQITEKGVQSLADKPNLVGQYGESGLTAFQLKLRFDKLASFLAERINEIIEALSSDLAGQYIRVCLDEHKITNVDELINSFSDGSFAENVLKLLPSAGATQAIALQGIINSFAENISKIQENKLDKITTSSTENRVYGISPTGKDTAFAVSSNPIGGAIPLLDSDARLAVETPKKSTDAVNKDYSDEQDKKLGAFVEFSLDTNTYVLTLNLKNSTGDILSTAKIDFPMESVVVGGSFDEATSEIVLVLKNGNEIRFPVSNIVGGFISDKEFEVFLATKGQPNGFAGLDANGKVPKEQLPAGSGGDGISAAEFEELLIESLTNPTEEWADEERVAACETIGALNKKYADANYTPMPTPITTGPFKITSVGKKSSGEIVTASIQVRNYGSVPDFAFPRGDANGCITVAYPKTASDAANMKYVDDLTAELRVEIYDILDLAGVTETIETTSTYDVRDTAQVGDSTLFVIPDTPTSVTKVEGNSVSTENLLDATKIQGTSEYTVTFEKNGASIVIDANTDAESRISSLGKFSDLIPTAKVGDELYFYGIGSALWTNGGYVLAGARQFAFTFGGSEPLVVTKEMLDDGEIHVTLVLSSTSVKYIQYLYVGKTRLLSSWSWLPHFTGLKSAIFNGIVSSSKNLWNSEWSIKEGTHYPWIASSGDIAIPGPGKYKLSANSAELSGITSGYAYVYNKHMERILGFVYDNARVDSSGEINVQDYPGAAYIAIVLNFSTETRPILTNTQLEYGDTITAYEPYMTPSKLLFPEIENPFGQTIDFADKKVLNYGVEITLTGEESIRCSNDPINGSVIIESILPTTELRASFISNFFANINQNVRGACWVGRNTKSITYLGGAYELGFIEDEDEATPTSEQLTSAAASFKAWLAKRYADGNPVVIRYISNVLKSSRDMTAEELANLNFSDDGATYTPIENGIEYQAGNSNAVYGANNAVTQLYDMYRKLGGA